MAVSSCGTVQLFKAVPNNKCEKVKKNTDHKLFCRLYSWTFNLNPENLSKRHDDEDGRRECLSAVIKFHENKRPKKEDFLMSPLFYVIFLCDTTYADFIRNQKNAVKTLQKSK